MKKEYWLVNAKEPYITISLRKLGVSESEIKVWTNHIKNYPLMKYIYVQREHIDGEIDDFAWSRHIQSARSWYGQNDFKYKGQVKIDDIELDAFKYNL